MSLTGKASAGSAFPSTPRVSTGIYPRSVAKCLDTIGNRGFPVALLAGALCGLPMNVLASEVPTDAIAAAVADPTRPSTDLVRDANRKPAEVLAFTGIKPGDKVADYAAGTGYFTRLFSDIVGSNGHVYASVPSPLLQYQNIVKGITDIQNFVVSHPNVSINFGSALDAARYPEKLDMFWISQNYHDLKDPFMGPVDMVAFNRAVYTALKPGGLYIVLDHVAAPGSPPDVTDTLHRIEPAVVRREAEAAGFRFVSESMALANPDDSHTVGPFNAAIRGRTDQFVYKFRKPMKGDVRGALSLVQAGRAAPHR
jgi:predicted methyltransferase